MKLTQSDVNNAIESEKYFRTEKTCICVLTLRNGYEVVGSAGVINSHDYDDEIGRDIARKKAAAQIWQLEGYLRQQKKHERIG